MLNNSFTINTSKYVIRKAGVGIANNNNFSANMSMILNDSKNIDVKNDDK